MYLCGIFIHFFAYRTIELIYYVLYNKTRMGAKQKKMIYKKILFLKSLFLNIIY